MMVQVLVLVIALITSGFGLRAETGADLYKAKIQPLLARKCLGCHNSQLRQSGLDLSSRETLLAGGENGPVVVPGDPNASVLYKLVAHKEQPAMPFKAAALPEESVALIAEWIKAGVPYDGSAASAPAIAEAPQQVDHWAFKRPVRRAVPKGASNPIDAFITQSLQKRGLHASPEAGRRALIRRVYLDLTGLPPQPADLQAFMNDKSPDAYEKVVDRLLASPGYGERWGRHWLDVWRYSDWYGWRKENQVRYSQRNIWRWRDWTVESLNANKGYDRMIVEMLAGDEIAPANPDVLRATGYLARSWYRFNRNVWLQEAAEYTAASFLGMTMKCARCHSHKYDPITHIDYYRFRAFFEPYDVRTDRVPGQTDVDKDGVVHAYDADTSKPTFRFIRGNENAPEKEKPLTAGVPAFLAAKLDIRPVTIPLEARYPDGRDFVQQDLIRAAEAEIERARADLAKAKDAKETEAAQKHLAAVEAALPALRARIAADRAKYTEPPAPDAEQLAAESRKLERVANVKKAEEELFHANQQMAAAAGSDEKKLAAAKKRLEAAVAALSAAVDSYTPIGKLYPEASSGRRLALAQWIASKDNPLTARVAVNHMWLRHFGKPLVPTVFNFGKSGKAPSHPELLEWLATEFMESGWDMKRMHRLMVTSAAYRRSSAYQAENPNVAIDPDNTYLWRMNTRRMEAEAVRDSLLFIAGKLDTSMGGPELEETKGDEIYRRSLYFRHTPDLQMEMLRVFDLANPNECFERTESVMPQQALAMANSRLSYTVARLVAASIHGPTPSAFITEAFDKVLGRAPSKDELRESATFLSSQAELYRGAQNLPQFASTEQPAVKPSADPGQRARESLLHVLVNHNDFVTIR